MISLKGTSSDCGTTAQKFYYRAHPPIVVQRPNNFITGHIPWFMYNGPTISLQATSPDYCTTTQQFHYWPHPPIAATSLIVAQRPNNYSPHPLIVVQRSNNFITGHILRSLYNDPTISLQATSSDCCTTVQQYHYRPHHLIVVQRPNNFITGHILWLLYNGPTISLQATSPTISHYSFPGLSIWNSFKFSSCSTHTEPYTATRMYSQKLN